MNCYHETKNRLFFVCLTDSRKKVNIRVKYIQSNCVNGMRIVKCPLKGVSYKCLALDMGHENELKGEFVIKKRIHIFSFHENKIKIWFNSDNSKIIVLCQSTDI